MTEAPGTHNPQFLPPNIRCLSRCRRPKLHRSICRSSVAGLLFMSIRVRACPVSIRLTVGTRSLAREAARRSRAHSTIIRAHALGRRAALWSVETEHRLSEGGGDAAAPAVCDSCRTRSSRSPAPSISRHFPPSSSAWRLSSMTTQSPRSSTRFYPPDNNAAEVIAWLQRSR
jgi:hypothetical protein